MLQYIIRNNEYMYFTRNTILQIYTVQHFNTKQPAIAMTKVRFYYNSNKNTAYIHFSAHTFYECFLLFSELGTKHTKRLVHYASYPQ